MWVYIKYSLVIEKIQINKITGLIFHLLRLLKMILYNTYDYTVKLVAIYIEDNVNNIDQVPTITHASTE